MKAVVGQAILPADALSSASKRRLKAGGSQDWLPHVNEERLMKKTIIATLILTASAGLSWAGATEGKEVFTAKCKACHGADGTPPAGMAKAMGIKPMKDVQALTDAQMQEAVLKGKGKMKPVAGVTEKQAADVVAFVRTLK